MSEDLSGLNLVQLIDLLEPVPDPQPLSLWPQTAGWVWLGALLMILGGTLVWRWYRRWRADAYRRAALRALAAADGEATAIAVVLRRCALSAFPRSQVASLHGARWLAFLDRTGQTDAFTSGPGRALATAPYRTDTRSFELADLAKRWIRQHRRGEG